MESTQVFSIRLAKVAERWEQALVEFVCCHWELPIDPECDLRERSLSITGGKIREEENAENAFLRIREYFSLHSGVPSCSEPWRILRVCAVLGEGLWIPQVCMPKVGGRLCPVRVPR